jgi:hypothetical protein
VMRNCWIFWWRWRTRWVMFCILMDSVLVILDVSLIRWSG